MSVMGSSSDLDDLDSLVDPILERCLHEHLDGVLRPHAVGAGAFHGAVDLRVLDVDDLDVAGILCELRPDVSFNDLLDLLGELEGRHLTRRLHLGLTSHGQHRQLYWMSMASGWARIIRDRLLTSRRHVNGRWNVTSRSKSHHPTVDDIAPVHVIPCLFVAGLEKPSNLRINMIHAGLSSSVMVMIDMTIQWPKENIQTTVHLCI